jgi:6-pyruvoyltetrahydropterin/6-carboxytetrahydropterin synthase
MYELTIRSDFAAAHRLCGYPGNCENLHGHSWQVEVRVRADVLNALGMACDFRELKKRVRGLVGRLDHKYLNEIPPFDRINPTTENLSRHLYDELKKTLPESVKVVSVTTWESPDCGATYQEE